MRNEPCLLFNKRIEGFIFFNERARCVYVHFHGDGVEGGILSGSVTLAQKHWPIRDKPSCRADVTIKEERTVSSSANSTTAKRCEIWCNNEDIAIQIQKLHDLPSVTGHPSLYFVLWSKKQLKLATKILLGGVSVPVRIGMSSNGEVSEFIRRWQANLNYTNPFI